MDSFPKQLFQTYLLSEASSTERSIVLDYLTQKLASPDEGSHFETALGPFRHLFRLPVAGSYLARLGVPYLERRGYDLLLLTDRPQVVGHTAFQEHKDNTWHVFSVERKPELNGRRLGTHMVEDLIKKARERGIERIRIGGGRNKHTNAIHADVSSRAGDLAIGGETNNWIRVLR